MRVQRTSALVASSSARSGSKGLARRALTLEESNELDAVLKPLVKETAPEPVATLGIGTVKPTRLAGTC